MLHHCIALKALPFWCILMQPVSCLQSYKLAVAFLRLYLLPHLQMKEDLTELYALGMPKKASQQFRFYKFFLNVGWCVHCAWQTKVWVRLCKDEKRTTVVS